MTFTPRDHVLAQLDKLIPSKIPAGTKPHSKARLTLQVVILGVVSTFFGWLSTFIVPDPINFPYLIAFIGYFATLFYLKKTGNVVVAGNLFCAVTALMLIPIMIPTGGIHSEMLVWLVLMPIIATLLSGVRSGVVWMVLLLGYLIFLANIRINPAYLYNEVVVDFDTNNHLVKYLIYFSVVPILFWTVQLHSNTQKKNLESKLRDLEFRNQKLQAEMLRFQASLEELDGRAKYLQGKNDRLEAYSHSVAHDLKEPLRSLEFFGKRLLTLFSEYKITEQKLSECAHWIQVSSGRLHDFITGTLDNAKLKAKPGTVALEDVLLTVKDNLHTLIEERQAQIIWAELPAVSGDEYSLVSVFQNLISNAILHTDSEVHPVIRVEAKYDNGQTIIYVNDNGKGIAMAEQAIIFQPSYQRVKRSHGHVNHGLGMGITHRNASNIGAQLELHHSQPGIGSSFRLTFNS